MNTAKDRAHAARSTFGDRVRELREERGYTRELLAGLAGQSVPGLKLIESGGSWPQLDTLIRLAQALSVTIDELTPKEIYDALTPPGLSFLERRFAQSPPQEAAPTGETAVVQGSSRSSQSSKAAGKLKVAAGRDLGQVAVNPSTKAGADKRKRRTDAADQMS